MAIVTPVVSKVASPVKTGISGTQPVNTLAPAIAGQPYIGETLTATPGTWTDADSVSGQWYVNGVATGDTDTSYTILLADAGLSIEYRETATNTAGSVTQASNAITAATLEQHVTRMFASGEQGAWYKLAAATTLFQDAAGTTPVTAVGQPVGLALDKRLGLVRGSELVTNGDFTTNTTGWAASNTTLAAVGGEIEVAASSGASEFGASQAITCVIGKTYHVTLRMRASASNSVANACRIRVSSSSIGGTISCIQTVSGTAPTPVSVMFVATATTHYIQLNVASAVAWGALGDKAYFDNVSVKLLDGNHAAQATTTKRPILPAAGYRLRSDFTDDALAVTLPAFDGEVWVNTPYGHYMTPRRASTSTSYNLPLNDATEVIIREGTTTQQQRDAIAAYFGNSEAPYGSIMLSPDTSIGINSYAVGAETPAVIRYIGANGVSVEKTYPTGNVTTTYDLAADGLTAPVAMILLNTGARYFYCNTNQITGSIPSLSANTALTAFVCSSNQLTGSIPNLNNNTALGTFACYTNQLTGSIPSLNNNTALTAFYCYSNQLTGVETGFAVTPSLGDFQVQNNNLTAAAVNAILAAFVAANRTTGTRILNLGGTGNAAPTGQGLTDKATLVSRGWTVTTN